MPAPRTTNHPTARELAHLRHVEAARRVAGEKVVIDFQRRASPPLTRSERA